MRFKCTSGVIVAGLIAGLSGLPVQAQDAAAGGASTTITDDSMMMDKMTMGMSADDKKMMMDMMGTMSADQHRVMMQGMQQGMMQGKMMHGDGMMGDKMMDDKMMMKSMTKGMSKADKKMMMDMMGTMTPEQKMMMQRSMMGQHMMSNGMMGNGMMPMMDDTMKSYMAADQAARNQMLDKMSLSQMVQFLTRFYAMPGGANMMMGNGMKPGMMQDNK